MLRTLVLLSLLCLVYATPAPALDLIVDTTDDGAGRCTLRAALQTANASAGGDQITLPAGVFALTVKRDTDLQDEQTGDLDVTGDTTITGAGSGATAIDAKGAKDRAFDVSDGAALTLESLAVRNGKANKTDLNPGQVDDEVSGGCVRVAGLLVTQLGVVIAGCSSPDDGGGIGLVDGSAGTLEDTWIDGCSAKDGGGGLEASDSVVQVRNTTFSGNKAKRGGGLISESGSSVSINNSTFANAAKEGANINVNLVDPVGLSNSVLVSKKGNDCFGDVATEGGNVESGSTCSLGLANDESNRDPGLADLADNGGEVPTHALLSNSAAVDHALNASCEPMDARGQTRVGGCDSGAYEFAP